MQVTFDSLNRFEVPELTICNPGSVYQDGRLTKALGSIALTSDEELTVHFNATSELNFRAYKPLPDGTDEGDYAIRMFHCLKNRRLIFAENIGYFVVTDTKEGYTDGYDYKDIKAVSCEVEIQNKGLTYIENGTYPFRSLLEKIVGTLPKWKIGNVDTALETKYRTFEEVDAKLNTLAFLLQNMQDAYECIFLFDTKHRIIHAHDQNNYVVKSDIHLTKDDLIRELTVDEGSDDLYTALSVRGADELSIQAINPLGTSVIYNFEYYLDWMSDTLRSKVVLWNEAIENFSDIYYKKNQNYYALLTDKTDKELEVERLEIQLDMYEKCRANIVAESSTASIGEYNAVISENGGTEIDIADSVEEVKTTISGLIETTTASLKKAQDELAEIETELTRVLDGIRVIQTELSFQEWFTDEEYDELYDYIFEGTYTDEYIITTENMTQSERLEQMKILYDRAKQKLLLVSSPSQEFTVEAEDFVFEERFKDWSRELDVGILVNVELSENDIAELFLATIRLNWDDKDLSLTFGNRFNRFDPKALFDNVLGDIQKSANSIDYIKELLYPVKEGKLDEFAMALHSSRNLTMQQALSADDQSVSIDAKGYTGRKVTVNENGEMVIDPKQIKIVNNTIVFTRDAWETCATAVGEIFYQVKSEDTGEIETKSTYGINAKTIIGEMIIGGALNIVNENGESIFQIIDNTISAKLDGVEIGEDAIAKAVSAQIKIAAGEITAAVAASMDKYDTDGYNIDLYGIGHPDTAGLSPENYPEKYYLDQGTGRLYLSDGTVWARYAELELISQKLGSRLQQTEDKIASSVVRYDTTGLDISAYGFGSPVEVGFDPANYAGQYYLDQDNGKVYISDGTAWRVEAELTLVAEALSKVTQTADGLSSVVYGTEEDEGLQSKVNTLIEQGPGHIRITAQKNGNKLTTTVDHNSWTVTQLRDGETEETTCMYYDFDGGTFQYYGAGEFRNNEGTSYIRIEDDELVLYAWDDKTSSFLDKIRIGFMSDSAGTDYPMIRMGRNSTEDASGLIKKFKDGLWLGNSAPADATGVFAPQAGYAGFFVKINEGKCYVVQGEDMQDVYTGDATAKFG